MNYAGKFDAAIPWDGQGSRSPISGHVDSFVAKAHGHLPDGAVVVPDPNLIFNGEFKRTGLDLVLSHDGHDFVVHDYFKGDKRAAIASPDGAHLTGDTVNALTGHVQYAQAAPGIAAAQVIGHVTKLSGSATAIRNGVSVILNNGDNVEKGDVVSTGADSTLGITFIDGTVFGLSSNARMVLNEMVYDPNGSSNSSLLSLVAGTITFVAGETAKHGDMKIDTPVATMGIRGTAVLTQINFVVPAGGGDPQPQASFQVLVEPNGTTGSYILFDKITLLPIATVNQAGQVIQISGGNVSISNALMSPDVQKLITDVFTLKFTDNNTNTKLTTNFTDTITPTSDGIIFKTQNGTSATAIFNNLNQPGSTGPGFNPGSGNRVPGPPDARSLDLNGNVKTSFSLTEQAGATGDRSDATGENVGPDTISGRITFVDQNLGDRPTVSVTLADAPNYVYTSAGQDVTGTLSALQKQDIAATQIQINVSADGGNANNGSAIWTYTIPDHVFDFLAAGEKLTLTYYVLVNNNFAVNPETFRIPITITITGTNDKPVITTSVPVITFEGGTSVPGGPLASDVPTSGTLTFKDVDLTDTHSVSVALTSATLPNGTVPPGPLAAFQHAMSAVIAAGADSKGTGTGTINWSLADLPVYLADFIPKNAVLTLVYTVTLTDSQGAISQQTITVTITGTDAPAVVWIATDKPGHPSGGFWKDAGNWATGTVPTISDDVIVITDQLRGLTPSYPVTIDSIAYAKSITMNDFGGPPPKVIVQASLTIAGALNMGADSILNTTATGTMSVGGKAEILDTSVLTNAGWLTLAGGGDFAAGTTITNSGTIELSGGTLKTLATIHNTGGTLRNEVGTTLIVDTATVDGGTVMILGTLELDGTSVIENGALNNYGTVNVKGTAEFADETVSNTSTGTIRVLANGWLTVDQGSSVTNNGHVTIDASGRLTINGATIDGGASTGYRGIPVSEGGNGETVDGTVIVISGPPPVGTVTNDGEIDLTGDAVLTSGILKNNATIKVSGAGNALSYETVTNAGTIEVLANGALAIDQGSTVDNATGNVVVDNHAVLTLDDATISGGAVKGVGTIDVTGASKIDSGATVSISTITADAALTLDGVTVSGTVITDKASVTLANTVKLKDGATIKGASAASKGAVTNSGTLEITGAATLLNDILTNTGHIIKIDDGQTLTLSGTEINGGTVNNYSGAGAGTIDVTGNSTLGGNVTLNKGNVTVENGVTLTFGDATVATTAIANHGTVKVDAGKTTTLNGASLTGGTLTVAGTLGSTGTTAITDASISNTSLIEATLGVLTLLASTSATSITNSGTIRANGAELDINGEAVTNTGTLGAINNGTLKLSSLTVSNDGGTVSTAASSTLDLAGVTIDGGTVTIAGTLDATGTSAIHGADIIVAGTGTMSVTSGTFTVDPGTTHAIVNHGLIEAVTGGTLKLTTATITNTGTISVAAASKLYLSAVTINGGSLTNAGNLYSAGASTVTGSVTNTGTIEVQSGTLDLSGGISGEGQLVIDDNATLALGGADAQTVTFAGGTNTLELDNTSHSFTGTIAATSSTGGTFTVTGDANIVSGKGAALAFTASGGTAGSRANIVLTPTGTITGATDGIVVTQNGIGDISLTTSGDITGQNGNGIVLRDGANGASDITATIGGGASGAVGLDVVSHGDGDVTITNNGHVAGTSSFGIHVDQDDAGATGSTHITNHGSVVGANGSAAISIQENATGTATIDNDGTIGPDDADTVMSSTSAIVETGGHVTINNSGDINGNISVASATFNNYAGGTWTVAGTSVFGDASTIINHGEIDLHGASISGTGLKIENAGHINSYGTASISGTVTNTGAIEVHDGALTLYGSLSGTGSVTVDVGAHLNLEGEITQSIALHGDGAVLQIDTATFNGSIAELSANDKIGLSTINYGVGTSAVYVANADPSTGGTLTVTDADGNHIDLKLTGADYSSAHFAGSNDGTGHTLITIHADDDAPAFTATGATLDASFSERESTTSSPDHDPVPAATGSVGFTDIDLTDLPTAKVTSQSVTWLDTNGTTHLTLTGQDAALEQGLSIDQTGKNNGTVTWSYSVADNALDFLAEGQTAQVVSTITLDDHHGGTSTAQVTVTITGKNDLPTLDDATLPSVAGNESDPDGTTIKNLLATKFYDVDAGASLKAVAVVSDAAASDEGVWQYEVAGTHQWVDIGSVGDTHALVLGPDALLRFVPAEGFTGTPGGLGVHALDNTYTGAITVASPATIDIASASVSMSEKLSTIDTEVTAPTGGPVIDTDNFSVRYNYRDNTDTLTNLTISDTDPGAATDTFLVTASTGHPGTSVTPNSASGSLSDINPIFQNGGTYNPGPIPPATERIDLTVTDSEGRYDTVHFIFNKAGAPGQGTILEGTNGKDVIFAAAASDTLIGGGARDQFVFAPTPWQDTVQHTVNDFEVGLDKIDLREFTSITSFTQVTQLAEQHGADTVINLDNNDRILLKNTVVGALHANDFILHVS